MLPETLNKPLPQTIQDTEQMGLLWFVFQCKRDMETICNFSIRVSQTEQTEESANEEKLLNESLVNS